MALLLGHEPITTSPGATACVVCGRRTTSVFRDADALAGDLVEVGNADGQFLHHEPVAVFGCAGCGSVFRDPSAVGADVVERYRRDHYPPGALAALHERACADLVRDAAWLLARGLDAGTQLLEVGSYTGAFLEFARDAGCTAFGIDVGIETSAFARSRGLAVSMHPFTADAYEGLPLDGVWVLNCFEQLPDPRALVRDAARLLPDGARLVIRTPSAEFIRRAHAPDASPWIRSLALANAVLGVPFARCLSQHGLLTMLVGHGFEIEAVRGRQLGCAPAGDLPAPWMDVAARRRRRLREQH